MDLIRKASLLGIPAELRSLIYEQLYESRPDSREGAQLGLLPVYLEDEKLGKRRKQQSRLHDVNKQLRYECLPMYLRCNTFVFDLTLVDSACRVPRIVLWAKSLGGEKLALIQNLIIEMKIPRSKIALFTIAFDGRFDVSPPLTGRETDTAFGALACPRQHGSRSPQRYQYCSHTWFGRYPFVMRCLKSLVHGLNTNIEMRQRGLKASDIEAIAHCGGALRSLFVDPNSTAGILNGKNQSQGKEVVSRTHGSSGILSRVLKPSKR